MAWLGGHDRLDRLNEVRDANLALIEAYTYDATGNRTSQQIGTNPVTTYSYPAQNHRLTQVGAASRGFDAVGNTLTGVPGFENDSASFDVRNRLTQVATVSNAQLLSNYNGRGERVLASQGAPAPALPTTSAAWTTSAGVRGYVYDEAGQVISMLIAGNPVSFEEIVWLDNTPIGRVESSSSAVTAVHTIHSEHLNTPRALANAQAQGGHAAGTVVWRWRLNAATASGSNAFGAQAADEDADVDGTTVRFDLRFPGQQWDAAVGLNYNYFRDYEPQTGRYVESDPIGLKGGVSTFGYVLASPLLMTDKLGLATWICRPETVNGIPVGKDRDFNGDVGVKFCKYICTNKCHGKVELTNVPGQEVYDGYQCWGAILGTQATPGGNLVSNAVGAQSFPIDTEGLGYVWDWIWYPEEFFEELESHEQPSSEKPCGKGCEE